MLSTASPQPLTAAPLAWRFIEGGDPDVFTVLARHYADDVPTTSVVDMDIDPDFRVHGCTVIRGERLDETITRELVEDVARFFADEPTRWRGEVR